MHPVLWFIVGMGAAVGLMQLSLFDELVDEGQRAIVNATAKQFTLESIVFELGPAVLL